MANVRIEDIELKSKKATVGGSLNDWGQKLNQITDLTEEKINEMIVELNFILGFNSIWKTVDVETFADLPTIGEPLTIYFVKADNKRYMWGGSVYVDMKMGDGVVNTINGREGDVILSKSDVGLSKVDNTTDAEKVTVLIYSQLNTTAKTLLGALNELKASVDTKSTSNNPTFTGTVTVNGNIVQNGSAYETHAEQVYTKKDEIILREGALTGLADGVLTGIRAKLYDGVNDGILGYDKDGFARVGDVGSTQRIATIEDSPINYGVPYYDNTTKKLKTVDVSPTSSGATNNIQRVLKTENGVETINGIPIGAQKALTGTGAKKIKLPTTQKDIMFKLEVDIYNYTTDSTNDQLNTKLIIKGNDVNGGFGSTVRNSKNCQVTIVTDDLRYLPKVYFCTGATESYLIIGEVSDTMNLGSIVVKVLEYHHETVPTDWTTGWDISLVTTLETLDANHKVTVNPKLDATNLGGYVPSDFMIAVGGFVDVLNSADCNMIGTTRACFLINPTNAPKNTSGFLEVKVYKSAFSYVEQVFTDYSNGDKYTRCFSSAQVWSPWVRLLTEVDYTKLQKYAKAMAIAL